MGTISRSLLFKKLVAIDGARYPAIAPLDVHVHLRKALQAAKTVGDRHCPAVENVKQGKACIFLEPSNKVGDSLLFHAYIYTAGKTPDQVVQAFNAATADITADQITTDDGDPIEIVERVACLVYGESLVIENARVYGSLQLVLTAIRELIRRHATSSYPRLSAEDVPGRDFKTLAKLHKGVKKVTARVKGDFNPEPDSFGATLESMFTGKGVQKFKQIEATVEAERNGELDVDTVLAWVDESEGGTGLSGISVTFNDKTGLADLDRYREKIQVEVQEVRPGVPAVTEIETAMLDYLNELANGADVKARLIDSKGVFLK